MTYREKMLFSFDGQYVRRLIFLSEKRAELNFLVPAVS